MANAVHQLSTDSAPSFSRVGAPISGTTRPMPFCINKLIQLLGADKIRKATGRSRSYIYQCGRGKKIPSLEFLLGHDDSRRPGLLRFAAREPNLEVQRVVDWLLEHFNGPANRRALDLGSLAMMAQIAAGERLTPRIVTCECGDEMVVKVSGNGTKVFECRSGCKR